MRYDTAIRRKLLIEEATRLLKCDLSTIGTVKNLSRTLGVSADHLSRTFVDIAGKSLAQTLNNAKRHRAKLLLETTREDIKQISLLCGFLNADHFSVWFKRQTKRTPTQFRSEKISNRKYKAKSV